MPSTVEFPFSDDEALPTIPVILSYADSSVSANALLDTGSTVNVLPYDSRFAHFFWSSRNCQKNRKSRCRNGFSDFPKFSLNYHPALKTLFLCELLAAALRYRLRDRAKSGREYI
jgi:hypothetical protein